MKLKVNEQNNKAHLKQLQVKKELTEIEALSARPC